MADDHRRAAVEAREPAYQRRVVGKAPVAVQLGEVREQQLNVVQRVGTPRMPRHQHSRPGIVCRRSAIHASTSGHLAPQACDLVAQALNLFPRRLGVRSSLELRDLLLDFLHDRLLSVRIGHDRSSVC